MGVSSIITNDVVRQLSPRWEDPERSARLSRIIMALIPLCCCPLSTGSLGDIILRFTFMSMALRAAVICLPLLFSMHPALRGRGDPRFAVASIIVSPLIVLILGLMDVLSFDPLFIGMAASVIIMALGCLASRGRRR